MQFNAQNAVLDPICRRYLFKGYKQVEGWMSGLAGLEIACLARLQSRLAVTGPICEIGVHHGRSFILLHLLTRPGELTVGIDRYECGKGGNTDERKARVYANLRLHRGDPDRVRVLSRDSLDVTPAIILETCAGRPRLFSIDGGRTADDTRHDLGLAAAAVCDGGLVMVDDYFQESWPGVSEGVCRFMLQSSDLFPVAIGGNKLFFTKSRAFADAYRRGLASRFAGQSSWSVMFGEPVLVIGAPTLRQRIAQTKVWKSLRKRPVGRLLRHFGRRWV